MISKSQQIRMRSYIQNKPPLPPQLYDTKRKHSLKRDQQHSIHHSQTKTQTVKRDHRNLLVQSQCSTQPQPQMAPMPISQTKLTKTYCNLNQIPVQYLNPLVICQLYLSHNCISSVKHTLRLFTNLRNLNISYNLLYDTKEFINQIVPMDNYDNNYSISAIQLKMLNLRMNRFGYGYQDQIIRYIHSLQRFQDYLLIPTQKYNSDNNKQHKNAQNSKQIFQIASRLSQYFLPAYQSLSISVQNLIKMHQVVSKSSVINKSQIIPQISLQKLIQNYQQKACKLSALLKPKQQIKYLPSSRSNALEQVLNYVSICLDFIQNQIQLNSMQRRRETFISVVREILVKFANRNNYSLINTLQNRSNQVQDNNYYNLDEVACKFGQIFQARRHTIHEPNPGKYLNKINPSQVSNHLYLEYIEQQYQDNTVNTNTLDGNRRRCKNTIIRQLENYNPQQHVEQQKHWYFQNLPLIVYERNYLQILHEIWQQKSRQFLKMYDILYQLLKEHLKEPKFEQVSIHKQSKDVGQLDSSKYLQDSVEISHKTVRANRKNKYKKSTNPWVIEQKDSIQIEKNQTNTLKYARPQSQCDNNETKYQKQQLHLHHKEKQKERNNFNIQQNIVETQINTQQNNKVYEKTIQQDHNINAKTKTKANDRQDNCTIRQNISKYSVYQLNLLYKVLIGLKKNRVKNKRKREKRVHKQRETQATRQAQNSPSKSNIMLSKINRNQQQNINIIKNQS